LHHTEELYIQWIDNEVREAMGLTTEESYYELFEKYVQNVSHWTKNEKMIDPQTGDFRDPDENFMKEIERVLLAEGEKMPDFRKGLISTIGARALDHPDVTPDYSHMFKNHIIKLREDFYATRHKLLGKINENFLHFIAGELGALEPKDIEQSKHMLAYMRERFGYCEYCAQDTVAYLFKKRYAK